MKEFIRSVILAILTAEARLALLKYRPRVVVVTGSVGKTSTKDAAYAAMKGHTFVRKSEKSYNSDIGVPLTILGIPNGWGDLILWMRNILNGFLILVIRTPYPAWLVVEVGADRPGDLSRSLRWLTPDIVIATRIPVLPVHVEFYSSPDEVFQEEAFPLSQLGHGGVAVIPADDPRLTAVPLEEGVRRLTYGFGPSADVRVSRFRITASNRLPSGISFDIGYQGARTHLVFAGVLGRAHASAIAAGVAGALVALAGQAGTSLAEAVRNMHELATPPGRMRLVPGLKGTMLIDDTYNASPAAVEEALQTLKDAPRRAADDRGITPGRRIAVLGDMMELGNYSVEEHEKAGRMAAACADLVVAVGVRARGMNAPHAFERASDAAAFVLSVMEAGDLILIKGSQSMRMERVVKALMASPEHAKELLCRQDPEWLAR
jgi:UDP-N-acetylmuramyl pentapeptide synthase